MVRHQREDSWQVIAAGADFQHPNIQLRQLASPQCLLQRCARGQVGLQLLDFRPQRPGSHVGGQLLQRAFEGDALSQHRGELLVEEGKLVVSHLLSPV